MPSRKLAAVAGESRRRGCSNAWAARNAEPVAAAEVWYGAAGDCPFAEEHVPAAARLLALRQERHRAAEPLLAPIDAGAALERVRGEERIVGRAALRGGELVGNLIGALRQNAVWSRHVWIERAGHAAFDGEVLRDLYATAASEWLKAGAKLHLALVPAAAA